LAARLWYNQIIMRTQLRIVAGSLRGRKLTCNVSERLRPAPQMVREALFSILGDAVPGRPFFDLFAGTGAIGLEALSRGASAVLLIERDFRVADEIQHHVTEFQVGDRATVVRADVYRWAERWPGTGEPVNLFLGPPYSDFERRPADLTRVVTDLQRKAARGSVLILQGEDTSSLGALPGNGAWDIRRYGRNQLWIWVKEDLPDGPSLESEQP
jgi:16S rRNA (guanine966-N2)-methyltransferase